MIKLEAYDYVARTVSHGRYVFVEGTASGNILSHPGGLTTPGCQTEMYNRDITHAPVTLFLGAGASKPLDKMLMNHFISALYGDPRFGSDPLFGRIAYRNQDLEFLFEELEDWKNKEYMSANLPSGGSGGSLNIDPAYWSKISAAAAELLGALRRKVFEAYKDINPTKVVPLFNKLLEGIFNQVDHHKYPLVVFTTNYDPAVETYCNECRASYELEDGFGEDGWRREEFDNFSFPGTKKHIALFKLHGSVTWVKRDSRITRFPFGVYSGPDADFENVLIYPATKKAAVDDPFRTAYDYFQRTMDLCGCCIVIGYSFRDHDALTKLASASIFNPRLKVLVVDPDSENLCRMLSEKGIRCTPVRQKFGEDIAYMQDVATHIAEALNTEQPS
jgi:hypothetical protein